MTYDEHIDEMCFFLIWHCQVAISGESVLDCVINSHNILYVRIIVLPWLDGHLSCVMVIWVFECQLSVLIGNVHCAD